MKKLLLSLLAVVGLSFASSAQDPIYSLEFGSKANSKAVTSYTDKFNVTVNGLEFNLSAFNNNGNGEGKVNTTNNQTEWTFVRCGRKNNASTATITTGAAVSAALNKVVINAKKQKSGKEDSATSAQLLVSDNSDFTNAETYNFDVNTLTTTSSDITIDITSPAPNKFYQIKIVMPANTNNGWLQVNNVKFYGATSGDVKQQAGIKYEQAFYTINLGDKFDTPELVNNNNLPVTYSSSNEDVATVNANTGEVTVKAVGVTVIKAVSPETDKYYEGSAQYTLKVTKSSYDTVAEFYTVGENNKGKIGFDLIVTYVNGQYCYAQTEEGEATLVFGSKTTYKVGDIIPAGWEGQYAPYSGLPEIKPVGTMPAAAGSTTIEAPEVESVSDADVNKVVVLKNVEFAAAVPATPTDSKNKANFTGKAANQEFTFRTTFSGVPGAEAGTYDVKCAVAIYSKDGTTTLQLYPIEYIKVNGIENVVIDENAPVEYFNLQGVRVAEPTPGLYIIRQGNKVSKTIVR